MTDRIFAEFAPLYWAAGLPVIPLRRRNKMPDINQWSVYGSRMPSAIEMDHWLASFPHGNIGLPLGPQSGICVIDIDTEDLDLIDDIVAILPVSPWKRVGKKGMALAYRFEGQKNFKLRAENGGMILEFLGLGNQVVVPPSIHPDTGMPYTANVPLYEVMDKLPPLGEDIEERLRGLLGSKGHKIGAGGRSSPVDVVPAGERDVQMVRHAGYLARVVLGIDKSQSFSLHEAVGHMHHWVSTFTAKVSGDAMDPDKGVAKLLEFLLRDLEKGRTMPENWDAALPPEWEEHASIKRLRELNLSQRWDMGRARGWLAGKLSEHPDSDQWALARVQDLVKAVSKDDQFSEFEFRALVTYIVSMTGKTLGLKKTDLLQLYRECRRGDTDQAEGESHALIARAVLDEIQQVGEVRFDKGQFWQWNGSCFKTLPVEDIYMYVANNVKDSMIVRTHSGYVGVLEVMERMCRIALVQSADRGINFANGYVAEDLRVLEHDPKFGATFTLPFPYDRENGSRCNRWLEFLHSCWGHEPDYAERVMALQEMFAATLFGVAPRYQRAFLLYGRAGTGKTQILNVLRAMLPPDAICAVGPQHWGERFTMTQMVGKAANICGELPERGLIQGNSFKEIIEGTPVTTEYKSKDSFVFAPMCAHWFASNFLPISHDTSRGFTRRWLILDFNHIVPESERIEGLAEQIVAEERDAIAAWALEGLRRLFDARGFTLPECHLNRSLSMRRANNSVEAFLQDNKNVVRGEAEILCREAYDQYGYHMRDLGRASSPVGYERFIQMLEDLDLEVIKRPDALGNPEHWVIGLQRTAP